MEYVEMELACREERLAKNRRLAVFRRNIRKNVNPFDMPDKEFLKMFRLGKVTVQQLYTEIEPFLPNTKQGATTKMSKLLTTLAVLGGDSYQRGAANSMYLGLSQTTVSQVMNEVVGILNDPVIYNKYVKFPQTEQERRAVERGYHSRFDVPGVLGCIDCTHVAMIKPSIGDHLERFYCRNRYYSRNVQIICDSALRIMNVDASYGGAAHDSFIWRMHELEDHMEKLCVNGEAVCFFGDSGYPLNPWLLTPILGAEDGTPEHYFNNKHDELHNTVKHCIRVLKARWRCLLAHRTLHYHHLTVGKIIYACCVLHNIGIAGADPVPHIEQEDVLEDRALQDNDYVLPRKEVKQLYPNHDLRASVAQRQRMVAHLWVRR